MTETERAIAIIEARLPLYTDIGQINALRECISSIRSAALSAGQAQPVAIKPLEWQHDGNASYCYCPVTDVRWAARNQAERAHAEATREARIRSALVPPAVPGEVQVKHKKRGSVYDVIGVGRMQAESWIDEARPAPVDMREVTIYRSVDDGALWVRPREEFEDGRFEALSVPLPEIEGGDKGDGWQPIETAPKDGTSIDLWGVNHLTWDKRGERIVNVKWGAVSDWIGRERDDWQHGRGEDFEPTHWMPLPAAPSASIEGETHDSP